ncbi:MAG: UDP-N-acetylmuramoyl-L-alanyl-D-glutamate--2,6-diaminopimelate ligase, partial [Alphaproteobacteria bacterium]|nr:UDP-N-acetylmuramoyl-L-alanyl-D-glutamate--2,6-diaminopimelate ligase [Alphaproteobacteria bacterium]
MMKIQQLIELLKPERVLGKVEAFLDLRGLSLDSREVVPGDVFAALPSMRSGAVPGYAYIQEAVQRGAVAILTHIENMELHSNQPIPVLGFQNPLQAVSKAAASIYERQPEVVVAVTGTNGKSSVVHFANQIWHRLRYRSASIGTLGVMAELGEFDHVSSANLTTPDAVALHKLLYQLAGLGVSHLAIEASSHGLDQYRLDGVKLSAAGFTNLSQDHYDYHKTKAAYFNAKKRLFTELLSSASSAVLNADIPEYTELLEICTQRHHRLMSYGMNGADIRVEKQKFNANNQELKLKVFGTPYNIDFPLLGHFQLANALCALGLVIGAGGDVRGSVSSLAYFQGVKGRLEYVGQFRGGRIYIDYAHTPDALKTVLKALRVHCESKLAVVFGCGGDMYQD